MTEREVYAKCLTLGMTPADAFTVALAYYIFGGKSGHLTGYADALVMVAEPNAV